MGKEAYAYMDKFIEAIEIVKYEPLIKEIYVATIVMNSGEPIFIQVLDKMFDGERDTATLAKISK